LVAVIAAKPPPVKRFHLLFVFSGAPNKKSPPWAYPTLAGGFKKNYICPVSETGLKIEPYSESQYHFLRESSIDIKFKTLVFNFLLYQGSAEKSIFFLHAA
jgi:hypothetical protein